MTPPSRMENDANDPQKTNRKCRPTGRDAHEHAEQARRKPPSYDGAGRKIQSRCIRPVAPCLMQACMRLSCDSRRGKSGGTTTVPYFVVTTIAGVASALIGVRS